jgi:crossover junction endodeoxyribonuclease RuvC
LNIAEFGGLLRWRLTKLCSDVREVPPSTLKQFATGKGNANKTLMVASLTKRYGVEFSSDDEYDAYGLARLGACLLGWEKPANDGQKKAVAKMKEMKG